MTQIADASLQSGALKPSRIIESSRNLSWRSLLLDIHEGAGRCDAFDTHRTADLAVIVSISGRHETEVFKRGRWRTAVYEPGSAGLVAGQDVTRLRWNALDRTHFQTAHLYVASDLIMSVQEEYRRTSAPTVDVPVDELAFRDPTIAASVAALMNAQRTGAPDVYADAMARWLTVHLLSRHASLWDPDEDIRQPGIISDKRLARVIEFISVRLAEDLRLEELAREAGISVHHFGRVFQARIGMTPHAYIMHMRFDLAQRLLATTDLPLSQIASRCGYQRPSAFSAAFQRRFAVQPRRYRTDKAS